MSNIKNLAEDIIQLNNKSSLLDDIVSMMNHIMKSTENTLKEDIIKITDGAKLECEVDLEKIMGIVEEISSYKYSMEDELSNARGSLEDAESSCGYLEDEVNGLRRYLVELPHKVKEDKVEDKE